jgi:hypothetical protein
MSPETRGILVGLVVVCVMFGGFYYIFNAAADRAEAVWGT